MGCVYRARSGVLPNVEGVRHLLATDRGEELQREDVIDRIRHNGFITDRAAVNAVGYLDDSTSTCFRAQIHPPQSESITCTERAGSSIPHHRRLTRSTGAWAASFPLPAPADRDLSPGTCDGRTLGGALTREHTFRLRRNFPEFAGEFYVRGPRERSQCNRCLRVAAVTLA